MFRSRKPFRPEKFARYDVDPDSLSFESLLGLSELHIPPLDEVPEEEDELSRILREMEQLPVFDAAEAERRLLRHTDPEHMTVDELFDLPGLRFPKID